jgi:hypothetical protein
MQVYNRQPPRNQVMNLCGVIGGTGGRCVCVRAQQGW